MRISRQSIHSAAVLACTALCTAALAQDSARQKLQAQGETAMQRLEDAVTKAKRSGEAPRQPVLPGPAPEEVRQRATEDLRRRAPVPQIEQRARAALAQGEARLAAERETMARRLRQALGLEADETEALAKAAAPPPSRWVPVLFVSASMPLPVLRAYAAQLERVHGVLALRGMPGGLRKVGPMAKLTAQTLRLDPGCEGPACAMRNVQVIIDPILFRQHGVAQVPALAMIPGDPTQPYCERDNESPRSRFLVYGDSALPGLLDEFARLGGRQEVRDAQALLGAR